MEICSEKNRCSANPCGENGSCVNENSSYRCNCNPGYQFDGNTCYDVDECNEQVTSTGLMSRGISVCKADSVTL